MPSRVTAAVEVSKGCPLYKVGDRLTFAPPAVSADGQTPVCVIAVQSAWKPVDLILRGQPSAGFARTFCGGCAEGKAWLSFALAEGGVPGAVAPDAANPIVETLASLPLFSGIPNASLAASVRFWESVTYAAGTEILRKGDPAQAFLVVLEGTVDVVQRDDAGGETFLASLQRGECLGEMSMITGNPISATARAHAAVTALKISRENFPHLLAAVPALSYKLAKILAHRLARTGVWISDELKKGVLGKFEMLSPFELVQSMSVNAQTGTLAVRNGDVAGDLYFENGQIYEFQIGGREDLDAFFEFLRWQKGTFRLQPGRRGETIRRVNSDTMGLLLEGMRRIDEATTIQRKPQ